ncbi:MAG: hypothetical protein RL077_3829 [Verrucomicrobiota bacterium]
MKNFLRALPALRPALTTHLTALLFCGPAAFASATPAVANLPASVQRVVFLGDSITHSGFYVACIEAYFLTRHPERLIEFINLGLSSETVSGLSEDGHAGGAFPRPDLHERLARVLAQTKPDLVFACYGMNDGIYLPYEATRAQAFALGIARLRTAVLAVPARLVHLTPPPFDNGKGTNPHYAGVLERYSADLNAHRGEGWDVIDTNSLLTLAIRAQRVSEPAFTFAKDGVHPDERGHAVMARAVLNHLGAADLPAGLNAADLFTNYPQGAALLNLVRTRQALMKDAWLTATGHKRPMKPGLPLPEARVRAATLDAEIRALIRPPTQ